MLDGTGLAAGLAFGVAVAVALRSLPGLRRGSIRRAITIALAALVVAGLGAAPVWRTLVTGYPGDSFYTLSPTAGVGLAMLSLALIGLLFAVSHAKSRWLSRRPSPAGQRAGPGLWVLDLVATLALAYLALWLVPQVYYLYYLAVFDGLPWQSVIKPPPAAGEFFRLLLLSEPASLSTHLQGVTARALLLASATPPALVLAARTGVLWVGALAAASHLAGSLVLAAIGL